MVEGQPLTIGTLTKRMGLRPSAVRYYQRRGILPRPQRLSNGYRFYDDDPLVYLRPLRQTQALGITLKGARELVRLLQSRKRPCERVHELVAKRLREVDATIRDLSLLRRKTSGDPEANPSRQLPTHGALPK